MILNKKLPFSVFGFLFSLDFDEADSVETARCSYRALGKVLQKKKPENVSIASLLRCA
jgi:hypothetical protein